MRFFIFYKWESGHWAGCPITQTSDLNVGVNNQFKIELKKDVES